MQQRQRGQVRQEASESREVTVCSSQYLWGTWPSKRCLCPYRSWQLAYGNREGAEDPPLCANEMKYSELSGFLLVNSYLL